MGGGLNAALQRIDELGPVIAADAAKAEELGHLTEAVVDGLRGADRLSAPTRPMVTPMVAKRMARRLMTVGGERVNLEAAHTSTWVRYDDAWRFLLHTESVIGDPFGRDRSGATA